MEWLIVLIVVVALVVLGALAATQTRSASLKRRFGPEYDRVVDEEGDRRAAENRLRELTRRRDELDIRDLPEGAAADYVERWRAAQLGFVDDPPGSVAEAEALVQTVARERGYPVDGADDDELLAVDFPRLVGPYRVARTIRSRQVDDRVTLDDLRLAFRNYRGLFVELLGDRRPERPADGPVPVEGRQG
jgi:hypothetical protein